MNLLSKNNREAAPQEEAAGAPAPAAAPELPPIISALTPDAAVSGQIKSALEDALKDELGPQPPAEPTPEEPAPEQPAPEGPASPEEEPAAPQPSGEAAAPALPEEAPASMDMPQPPAQPEESAAAEDAPNASQQPQEGPAVQAAEEAQPADEASQITYVNVMQVLVEEQADRYMEMLGVCQCPRCKADVKALALNNLTPKYVAMHPGEMVPRITVYEGRFHATVTAQLLHACQVVIEHPHHREEL